MDLRGFVEEMDFESFDLVAHSIGSRVAMSYARDHSHRLNHLVLADMGPEMAGSSARAARTVVESPRAAGFATEAEAIAYYATLYPAQTKEFLQRQVAASLVLDDSTGNLVFRFDPSIHQATGRAAIAEIPYLWESLEHIKCPTLVIRAENSKVLSEEIARQMVERLPAGRYLEIAGSGHQVPLQQPDAFTAAIADFLDL
jgi:pimeloyl-ACP methyl ester carboxylesterase